MIAMPTLAHMRRWRCPWLPRPSARRPIPASRGKPSSAQVGKGPASMEPAWSQHGSFEPAFLARVHPVLFNLFAQWCSFIPSSANPATFCCHICRTRRRPLHQGHVPGRQRRPALPEGRQCNRRYAGELQLGIMGSCTAQTTLHWGFTALSFVRAPFNWHADHAVLCCAGGSYQLGRGLRSRIPRRLFRRGLCTQVD